ncbi:21101_t:CDS:2, partial [Gigaspora rosea]
MWSQSDSNSDVKIIVGTEPNIKEFNAHSSVLRSRSLYFQRALSERWKDQKHGIYIITQPNIHPDIFMLILNYIYTGKNILNASAEDFLNILVASDELELLDIIECAQKHLIKEFTPWLFSNLVKSLNVVCHSNTFIKSKTPSRRCSRLITNENKTIILSWIDKKDKDYYTCITDPYKLKLLLRGSRDGFDVDTFHRLCDFQGPTIVILKTTKGDLIGGYNSVNWNSFAKKIELRIHNLIQFRYGGEICINILHFIFSISYFILKRKSYFSKTSDSFIFSFTDQSNPVLSRIKPEAINMAIWNNELSGPSFGASDLCMKDSNRWISYWGAYERKITNSNELIAEEYE